MNKLLPFLILLCSYSVFAQESQEINANNIRTILPNDGRMFYERFNIGQFQVPFVDQDSPAAITGGGLWVGGRGASGLKVSAIIYDLDPVFEPGLFNQEVDSDMDRVWKVTKEEIIAHIQDASDGKIDDPIPESITSWPAAGNDGLENIEPERLASFVDVDGDNLYDPLQCDYPAVIINGVAIIPDEIIMTIIHTSEGRFETPQLEIHNIFYAFNGEGNELLANSLFMQQKVISRETEDLEEFRFSYFMDIDVGCIENNYFGTDVARNSIFGYSEEIVDEDCPIITYDDPPILSLTMLNNELTYSSYWPTSAVVDFIPAINKPYLPDQKFGAMGAIWRDGTPLTEDRLGYNPDSNLPPVRHAMSGNPTIPGEWSMVNENIPGYGILSLATHEVPVFSPSDILTMDAVIHFTNCPGWLEDIPKMKENIDLLQEIYDTGFSGVTLTQDLNNVAFSIFPNPSSGRFILGAVQNFKSYEVLTILGESITNQIPLINNEIDLNLGSGTYLLRVTAADGGISTHKFIIE